MIEAIGLKKSFGTIEALTGIDFRAGPGRILGLLGPNGAGKSTLMRILAGYHRPDSGRASICGIDTIENPVGAKRLIGYLPETFPVYPEMSVTEYLGFIFSMRMVSSSERRRGGRDEGIGSPSGTAREAMAAAMEACGIADARNKLLGTLSRGYRQRVGLAQAIIHDPPVLILDEPTSGLDPLQAGDIRSLITRLGAKKTILFSTHILSEAEAACSEILVLSRGRLAGRVVPGSLPSVSGTGFIDLILKAPGASVSELERVLYALPGLAPGQPSRDRHGDENGIFTFRLACTKTADTSQEEIIASWARESGYLVLGLSRTHSSLESLFAELTRAEDSP